MVKLTIKIRFIALLFALTSLLAAQSDHYRNTFDSYKNLYRWQEKENFSSNDSVLSVLGRWAWGPCVAVDADSNFAYIGNGATFQVLDISDPFSPVIAGEYLTEGYVYDIELRDNIAFVCTGAGFLILDISNPTSPQEVSAVSINGVAISFALVDSFAYVTTLSGAMRLIDISDVSNPYLRNVIGAGGQLAYCVEAKDKYVYIGNPEWPPMVIVDATNPDSLTRMDFEVGGWGLTADVKDTLLFVGVRGYDGKRYLKIFDISNASSPQFLSELQMQSSIEGITVSQDGSTAYVVTQSKGIYSVDLTNLAQPVILDRFERVLPVDIGNAGIALSQSTLFSAYYNELLMIDVSQPDSLKLRSFFPTGGFSEKISVSDTLAFVASGLSGLWIIDVSNPGKPRVISNVNTGSFTANLVVEDTLVYIVNWAAYSEQDTSLGLWIIDISNINSPKILSHHIGICRFATSFIHPNSIAKSGNLIFITQTDGVTNDSTLEIIDVSNPLCPVTKSVFHTSYSPYDVSVSDTIAFLATADGGVRVIDISIPENPIEISSILDVAFTVYTKGNFLYVSSADFSIVDVSDAYNPFVVSSINTHYGSSSVDLMISGNYAYWAEGALGVIDISDPENPVQIATFEGKDWGRGVYSVENKIFFADQTQGIWVLRNKLLTGIKEQGSTIITVQELSQNYPNPFNSETIIEFSLVTGDRVTLEIFDLLGRRIQTLLDKKFEAGSHKINFAASELPSGTYFYRLSAGRYSITKKMVVLR